MLLAEINGKYDVAVRDHEDYLTSTVFSHLRYVRPGRFWAALFSKAKALPVQGIEKTLTEVIGDSHDISRYEMLDVRFWPKCPGLGEPELAMSFSGGCQTPLVVLVEVKLWSPKSGQGKHDQLMRYLQIADSLDRLTPAMPANAKVVVVYLTPRESSNEVLDSLSEYGDSDQSRHRLFRLQWQDMVEAIEDALLKELELSQLILRDVRDFLLVRRLGYFKGFRLPKGVECLREVCGAFLARKGAFQGFQMAAGVAQIQVFKGAWCNAN